MQLPVYQQTEKLGSPADRTSHVQIVSSGAQALAKAQGDMWGAAVKGINAYIGQVQAANAMEASNFYNRRLDEETQKLYEKKEGAALNIVADYDAIEKKVRQETEKHYRHYLWGERGTAFYNSINRDGLARRRGFENYQRGETDKYLDATTREKIETAMKGAIAASGDPEIADHYISEAGIAAATRYYSHGAEVAEQKRDAAKGAVVEAMMHDAISREDFAKATAIFDKYGGLMTAKANGAYSAMIEKKKKADAELARHSEIYAATGGNVQLGVAEAIKPKEGETLTPAQVEERRSKYLAYHSKQKAYENAVSQEILENARTRISEMLYNGASGQDILNVAESLAMDANGNVNKKAWQMITEQARRLGRNQSRAVRAQAGGYEAADSGFAIGRDGYWKIDNWKIDNWKADLMNRGRAARADLRSLLDNPNPIKPADRDKIEGMIADFDDLKGDFAYPWQHIKGMVMSAFHGRPEERELYWSGVQMATNGEIAKYREEHGGKDPIPQMVVKMAQDKLANSIGTATYKGWLGTQEMTSPADLATRRITLWNDRGDGTFDVGLDFGAFRVTRQQAERIYNGEDARKVIFGGGFAGEGEG